MYCIVLDGSHLTKPFEDYLDAMAPNLRSKLGMFRKFGTIDLNYCFFHSQECEKLKSD